MYGGWVTSQGVQWRLQGQKLGTGNFGTLLVKPPGNISKKRSLSTAVEGVVKWAKRCLNSSKTYASSTVVNLVSSSPLHELSQSRSLAHTSADQSTGLSQPLSLWLCRM